MVPRTASHRVASNGKLIMPIKSRSDADMSIQTIVSNDLDTSVGSSVSGRRIESRHIKHPYHHERADQGILDD
jgi:hypothetical protein